MTMRLIVVGAGGFAREALDVVDAIERSAPGSVEVVGVVDDAPSTQSVDILSRRGIAVIGTVKDFVEGRLIRAFDTYVIAIGDPRTRLAIDADVPEGLRPSPALIHPQAIIGTDTICDAGVILCAGAVVSANVVLGAHTHVNPHATIGHDAVLGRAVSVNPAAVVSGGVVVGDGAFLGAASVVLQGLEVGNGAIVGASACVTHDVEPGRTVVGVPAR